MVHVASRAKNNWQPFVYESGAPSLYSNYITSSNEAFALFDWIPTPPKVPRKAKLARN